MAKNRVLLVCSFGMSTDFVVQKLNKKIAEQNIELELRAQSLESGHLSDLLKGVDVLLLAPQVRHQLGKIKEATDKQGIPVGIIPFQVYGLADAEKIIEIINELISKKRESSESKT